MQFTLCFIDTCGQFQYSGGGWQSVPSFSYGTFSFIAKGPTLSGIHTQPTCIPLIYCRDWRDIECFRIQRPGASYYNINRYASIFDYLCKYVLGQLTNIVNVSTFAGGVQSSNYFFQIPFSAAGVCIAPLASSRFILLRIIITIHLLSRPLVSVMG